MIDFKFLLKDVDKLLAGLVNCNVSHSLYRLLLKYK